MNETLCVTCNKRPRVNASECHACYMRRYRNGGNVPKTPAKEYNRIPSCHPGRKHRANGMCEACYLEERRRKRGITKRNTPVIICGHPDRKHHCKGMCRACYITSDYRKQKYAERMEDPARRQKQKDTFRANKLRKLYGLTPDEYDQMLTQQGGVCAICKTQKPSKYNLPVDHDHDTGQVRGILCIPCNRAIGYLENPSWRAQAETYLAQFRS